ncbi:membrane protein insertase YidC [Verrucomicrobiota bacterium]
MNKKDLPFIIPLIILAVAWGPIYSKFLKKEQPAAEIVQAPAAKPVAGETELKARVEKTTEAVAEVKAVVAENAEEIVLENDKLVLTLSSAGGSVVSAVLKDYSTENKEDSASVAFSFADQPALAYAGMNELSAAQVLAAQKIDEKTVLFTKTLSSGLTFSRRIELGDAYAVEVKDQVMNPTDAPVVMPALKVGTGLMLDNSKGKQMRGISLLGADSRVSGDLKYWGRKLHKLYKLGGNADRIDVAPEKVMSGTVDWVSAKNKFFTQIIVPHGGIAQQFYVQANKEPGKKGKTVSVASSVEMAGGELGIKESRDYAYTYYVGPKDYGILEASGYAMEDVMEFRTIGFWRGMNFVMEPARKFLRWLLVRIHALIPNYGVAIILLTLIVRGIFWPLTHKSTESMKRMSEIQPKVKELQAKYANNPQVMQQETMKLYKENKVNPAAGCLPMFIQIPVFFALYTVLRSAIELRFSEFLWIADLSEPENLFAGMIPFVGSLNILPLLMTATMVLQQHMTPSSADPQQKQMMTIMPLMMLFIFYTMPSGLTLYWTTSNVVMIVQLLFRRLKEKKAKA